MTDSNLNERVARLEQIAADTRSDVAEIRTDVKNLLEIRSFSLGALRGGLWLAGVLSAIVSFAINYVVQWRSH